ncbi:heat shock protein 70Cb isoform X2 [Nomia melanderi]|uniref:heat shock protein 70Cb isoform X2 n=1 Tax=Nomia melanderi TaxID=2448451 RepID=UPI0013045BC4|nr:97 kDa heat shock protein isoform X2 [Nomia melanderi]
MAAMSVIGIDFGNESCYVAVARAGGIETIANDYSLRNTPSCVAFSGKNRILGVAAKNQMVTNMKNTIYGFKRWLGRKYNDPQVQREIQMSPFKVTQQAEGNIGIHVQYLGEEHIFSPEQITAMLFTKLKDISETALQTAINDCVISVPSYFTQSERQALLDSAGIAGLNVLRLFNETTATALCYGIYKQDLPAPEGPPRNIAFVDCGYASLQVCICAFHKGKLKMLASASDSQLGGRDIDAILADHFCKDFQSRYNIDARGSPRAYVRLLAEVEKLKKQMSANSTTLPLNIECFMDEKDVHGTMKRADMEAMCAHLFKRVESTLRKCLEDSKLKLEEIHSIELVGGSSRVPAIKRLVEEVFNRPVSTTLNQDEAVSRGCALQCAMLSPAVRVRDFSVTDIQPYPITLKWNNNQNEECVMEVFGHNHAVPFSKMLTFYRSNPLTLTASYSAPPPTYPQTHIGVFVIRNIKPTPEGESSKVKVKVRINLNGLFTVTSASLIEKRELTQQEKEEEEKQHQQQQQQQQQQNMEVDHQAEQKDKPDQEAQANEPPAPEGDDKGEENKGKKKIPIRTIDLPWETHGFGLSQQDLENAQEKECKMIAADRQEKERIDARNALEEYVYDLRAKLSEEDELATFVTETDKEALSRTLNETEDWLYEEGGDCQRQVYVERLTRLKAQGEPIKERRHEFEGRSHALEELAAALQLAKKNVDHIKAPSGKDDKYSHLTDEEVKKIEKAVQDKWTWLEEKRIVLAGTARTQPPPVTVAQIRAEKQSLDSIILPILNKPKPKVEAPEEDKSKDKNAEDHKTNQNSQGDGQPQTNQHQSQEEKMDVESIPF